MLLLQPTGGFADGWLSRGYHESEAWVGRFLAERGGTRTLPARESAPPILDSNGIPTEDRCRSRQQPDSKGRPLPVIEEGGCVASDLVSDERGAGVAHRLQRYRQPATAGQAVGCYEKGSGPFSWALRINGLVECFFDERPRSHVIMHENRQSRFSKQQTAALSVAQDRSG